MIAWSSTSGKMLRRNARVSAMASVLQCVTVRLNLLALLACSGSPLSSSFSVEL